MLAGLKKGDGGDGGASAKGTKPGGGLLGGLGILTGGGGLKNKMTGMIGNKIDEAAWRSNLTDMHRVRNMARTLWLSLEHTNEAVMRVALEIVTCRKARKILWWNDESWSMEDDKPDHLRNVIEEKFVAILQMLGREVKQRPAAGDTKSGPSNREIELEKQVGDLQRKLKLGELSLAESRRLLEQQLEEARSRIAQLENSGASRGEAVHTSELERLRALEQEQAAAIASLQAELQKKAQLEAVLGERTAELERARKEAEEAKEEARQKAEELDRLRREGAGAAGAQLQKELDALRQKSDKLQAEVAFLKAQLATAQAARTEPDAPPQVSVVSVCAEDLAELERLRQLEAEWNSRGETCCTCGNPCLHCTGALPVDGAANEEKEKDPKKSSRNDKEVQELKELIERKDADIGKLKADKKELETERIGMLAMIDKLRKQINRLKEMAREAGHGDLVDKLMEESQISETMKSPEMSCFSRLYQDAVRRMTDGGGGRRKTTQKDVVRQPAVATRQNVFQMAQHFPGATPPQPQPLQHAPAASTTSLDYNFGMHGGRHGGGPAVGRHVGAAAAPQSLDFGVAGAGRGGRLDHAHAAGAERRARFELAGTAEAATYSAGGFLPRSGEGTGPANGGLPRHGGGNARMTTTTGSLHKGSVDLHDAEILWDFGGSMMATEGMSSNRRTLSTKPLGPGFAGPTSLRRSTQGLPRTDAVHRLPAPRGVGLPPPSGDAILQYSRSEPQMRRASGHLPTPNRLPQLPTGKSGQPPSRSASRSRQGSKGASPFG